jgi:hypothetical protein
MNDLEKERVSTEAKIIKGEAQALMAIGGKQNNAEITKIGNRLHRVAERLEKIIQIGGVLK